MTTADVAHAAPPRVAGAVRELVRVEAARLLRHPILLAGAALGILFAVTFARENPSGGLYLVLVGPAAVPLGLGALVAVNLATLRSRRSDTGELYGSLAAPARARTLAHLASAAFAAAAAAALTLAGFLAAGGADGLRVLPDGSTATPSAAELAQGPAAVAVLGALGVALGRWAASLPVAPVLGVGIVAVEVPFALWNVQQGWAWFAPVVNPARTGGGDGTWPCFPDQGWPCELERFAAAETGWHLLYLAGVAVLLGALALLRDERRPRWGLAALAGVAAATAGGVLQLP